MFGALDFLAKLTQHVPPKRLQLIRRHGLYASRTKGRWEQMPWVAERAPLGWEAAHQYNAATEVLGYEPLTDGEEEVEANARKRAWARLLAFGPLSLSICPKQAVNSRSQSMVR